MSTYTYNSTQTFTETHAKRLASKVATDLKRIQRFYHVPSDSLIELFESELISILKAGYLKDVTYGFKRNVIFIQPSVQYTTRDLYGANSNDDDPGKIRPGFDITNASFTSFLNYSHEWWDLSVGEREKFEGDLPFNRTTGPEPGVDGIFVQDRIYSAGGIALDRQTIIK
jgi:hypothetical protein